MDETYDQHCLAIGRMIVAFQSLEATLKNELASLMNSDLGTPGGALSYAVISELSFGTAIRVASAVPAIFTLKRLGEKSLKASEQISRALVETAEQLQKGLKLATEIEARRNQIVHSHWFAGSGYVAPEGKMTRTKAKTRKGSFEIDFKHESINDLESLVEKAGDAQNHIGSALRDYKHIWNFDWESLVNNQFT
jgi:hypothetical protein